MQCGCKRVELIHQIPYLFVVITARCCHSLPFLAPCQDCFKGKSHFVRSGLQTAKVLCDGFKGRGFTGALRER